MNLKWVNVVHAIARNREPNPDELVAALATGEEPPQHIRECIEELTDPNRKRRRGRPAYWGEKERIHWARLTLRCQLVDRVVQDRNVARLLMSKKKVPISEAFSWVAFLSRDQVSEALRTGDLPGYLLGADVVDSTENKKAKAIEQHYYVWQHPKPALLRQVRQRMDELLAEDVDEYAAAKTISDTGVYPKRSNKLRLPPRTIVSFYRRTSQH